MVSRSLTASHGARSRPPLAAALFLGCLAAAAVLLSLPSDATAWTGINKWEVRTSTTQAGGHPDMTVEIQFDNRMTKEGEFYEGPPVTPCNCDDVRIIRTHLPAGFIGNPHAVPKCTLAEFNLRNCPIESQVGVVEALGQQPIYNLETRPSQPGLIAFTIPGTNGAAFIVLSARTDSDYGLDAVSSPIYHLLPVKEVNLHLWGVPAASEHDPNRFPRPVPEAICFKKYPEPCNNPIKSNVPPHPYLQNPTRCGGGLSANLELEYYDGTRLTAETPWPVTTGCDQLGFDPSLTARPTSNGTDSPSGIDINLKVPQELSPTTPSPSAIRELTMTLPEGVTVNPSAVDGKVACTDEESAIGTLDAARCPEHAKVGTLTIDSSALPAPIPGGIYLGEPKPGDPYRLILTADGFATHVKLAGSAVADPDTGRVTVTFKDLPQTTFQEFDMHVFGSERGLLATPEHCGDYTVRSEFVPWNDALPDQASTSVFTIDSGPGGAPCPPTPRQFLPAFAAGSLDNTAGAASPMGLEWSRADGDQFAASLSAAMPRGFSASLRGIPYCPEDAIAALAARPGRTELATPACPLESQVGTVTTGAGAGSRPVHVDGRIFLAGPYRGAPLSLVFSVPAVSGPYDLGTAAVRAAVQVDSGTVAVSALSDPLPRILDGIPLRLKLIQLSLDRPGFARNPTNCAPFAIASSVLGDEGTLARSDAHYQVANCTDLDFAPTLGLRLAGSTKRTGHPALRAVLSGNRGDANLKRVAVTLPETTILDNANVRNPCTRVQFAADACPPGSVLGSAVAHSPLLDRPLEGPVYLRSGDNRLPDLVADLRGQLRVSVVGRIDTVRGRLRTTFAGLPDVPVSRFSLSLKGGARGLLQNTDDVCRVRGRATVRMAAHNNATLAGEPRVRAACGSAKQRRMRLHRAKEAGR